MRLQGATRSDRYVAIVAGKPDGLPRSPQRPPVKITDPESRAGNSYTRPNRTHNGILLLVEPVIIAAFVRGLAKRFTYGVVLLFHGVPTVRKRTPKERYEQWQRYTALPKAESVDAIEALLPGQLDGERIR